LYNSSNGYTKETQPLLDTTITIIGINKNLRDTQRQFSANAHGQLVLGVADECGQVSENIQAILKKCKVRKQGSILSAGNALIKARRNKSELDNLQSDLKSSSASAKNTAAAR
jgi:hypothetical protein